MGVPVTNARAGFLGCGWCQCREQKGPRRVRHGLSRLTLLGTQTCSHPDGHRCSGRPSYQLFLRPRQLSVRDPRCPRQSAQFVHPRESGSPSSSVAPTRRDEPSLPAASVLAAHLRSSHPIRRNPGWCRGRTASSTRLPGSENKLILPGLFGPLPGLCSPRERRAPGLPSSMLLYLASP